MARKSGDTYIALFRSVLNNPILWEKPLSRFEAWIWMIMRARVFDSLCFKRGQFIATRRYLMDEWGWNSERKVRTFLEALKKGNKDPMIGTCPSSMPKCGPKWSPKFGPKQSPRCLLITILNYGEYQGELTQQSPKQSPKQSPGCGPKEGPKTRPKTDEKPLDNRNLGGGKNVLKKDTKNKEKNGAADASTGVELSKIFAEQAIDSIDLQKFREKYPHLDMEAEHFSFKNHHLSIQANYHGRKKHTDWSRTFHTWCNAPWKKPKPDSLESNPDPTPPGYKGGWF